MSIFLMTFSDSEKSEFWDTPMAHMVTCFGNYHFLPLFLSTYSIPRILLEFAPPLKNSKKWGFQPRRIFFNGRILCGSGDGGWSTTVCSGHIWEALRCPFANYVLQKCVTVTDDHDAMDVYSLPLVGCFFFLKLKGIWWPWNGDEFVFGFVLMSFYWSQGCTQKHFGRFWENWRFNLKISLEDLFCCCNCESAWRNELQCSNPCWENAIDIFCCLRPWVFFRTFRPETRHF